MKCDRCNRKATVHLTEIIKDVKTELHLCDDCAREIGFGANADNVRGAFSLNDVISYLNIPQEKSESCNFICPYCGYTLTEYENSNNFQLGCPHCYTCFQQYFDNIIKVMHGSSQHIGKIPHRYQVIDYTHKQNNLEKAKSLPLQMQYEQAIMNEEYENAEMLWQRLYISEKRE